ncbi:DUF6429 family protein [Kinneretia asaccharophila]|uniref:DUF6429 domain-containing protein n=1 Tax=Roseateles asaccharophilus TaxID=582607 RepID=A0A4R6MSS5_9BURK|nr:DUF6429 family protein [Roseateles asaccharophilus]MDN3546534.1 DUF6429 family protein [Roseateles asaccharophilus]TDP05042.1 hypothetical protein DFR39_11274 [Roseateles asaccharophilus]
MEYDKEILQAAMLALIGVFEFDKGRAWKRDDFSVMDDLYKQGLITDPRGHRESVLLTEAGRLKAKTLAAQPTPRLRN